MLIDLVVQPEEKYTETQSWDSNASMVGAIPLGGLLSADTAALPSSDGSVSWAALCRGRAHKRRRQTGLSRDLGSGLAFLLLQERMEQLLCARPCAGGPAMAQAWPLLSVSSQSTMEPLQQMFVDWLTDGLTECLWSSPV